MPISDIFAAFRWWIVLMVLGAAATPLSFILFRKLADRGYAFVKMLGLLLATYIFWMLGSLGFLGNDLGGIFVSLFALIILSFWIYKRYRNPQSANHAPISIKEWLSENRSQVLLTELLFAALFFAWVWVRAQNPAITATEKPMEFAFLNAINRSPSFPPLDPWLSGFAISYYYFGYVMTSVIARLAFVPEQIAFNLGIAWLVAGTGVGAFGLVFNLLKAQKIRHAVRTLSIIAALAIPIAGNMVIGLEIAHANGLGTPAFWQWLDVRDLNEPPEPETASRYESASWWWWRSSRPIHEYHISGRSEEGLEPIAEFPGFSFLLGDMHPHVLALPFAFLSLAIALSWWLPNEPSNNKKPETDDHHSWLSRLMSEISNIGIPLWLVTALVVGGLSFLNTWDVLIHLFVILGAFALARWRDFGWHRRILGQTIATAILLLIPIILLYLPFYLGFRSQAGAPYLLPMFMRPTRLAHFLAIFAMPLWAITVLLIARAVRQRFRYWQSGLATAVLLLLALFLLLLFFGLIVASSPEGAGRIVSLAEELGVVLTPHPGGLSLGWGISAIIKLLPDFLQARIGYPAMTLFLLAIAGLIMMIWRETFDNQASGETSREHGALPFVLLLIATGTLLTLGPEFVYLRDNFGFRLNTIFKFYYQAWVMFGIAGVFALGYLWQEWHGVKRVVPIIATAGYVFALLIALTFPVAGINSRSIEYRGSPTAENRVPMTLNGLAQMARFNADEYAAITWLRENVTGTPVILEAIGGQYSNYGRVSASTGLPTLLGWAGHEYQWRGNTPEPGIREPVVTEIYNTLDLGSVAHLLDQYDVNYIYVGGLERDTYGAQGLEKFADQLDIAFSNNGVTIYRWHPQ